MLALRDQPDPYRDPEGWRKWAMGWSQQEKLDTLHPLLRSRVEAIFDDLRELGWAPEINYGWRHPAVQASLVAEGYTKTKWSYHGGVLTTPGLGWTAAALASDIYLPGAKDDAERARFYTALKTTAEARYGLKSGASYKPEGGPAGAVARWAPYGLGWDPAHVELRLSEEERDAAREAILVDSRNLLEPSEPVWAVPDGEREPYAVGWFDRKTSLTKVAVAAKREAESSAAPIAVGLAVVAAVAIAVVSSNKKKR